MTIMYPNQDGPSTKQVSKRGSLKINYPELDIFLASQEKDLFANIWNDNTRDNLMDTEQNASRKWRKKNLFKKVSNNVMKLEDEGKQFVVVNEGTDCLKALQFFH